MINNELFGWLWILVGFVSGMVIGLRFHEERWLGGYGSHQRRLIRLGHISFIGLGILNILFVYSLARIHLNGDLLRLASWTFFIGGLSMPICCGLMAWRPSCHLIFAIPVISLMIGGILTVIGLIQV